MFFLTYAVLEIPSNLFLTRIGARRWIARIMITWGIISCGMAFVTGPTSFYVMRLLLGAAEAGLYPGIIYYLTLWFGREERAKATGLFLLGVCLANIIGAPLGGLLLSLDGMSGWHGWQWMFFIEGLPAIALAFVVWRRLPDKPADARWLDSNDMQAINAVLEKEAEETRHTPSRFSLKTALTTRVFLLLVLIYFTHQFSVYGLSYFLPGIIGSWGQLTPLQIGLLTAIPWIAAAAGGILLPRFARTEQRSRSMLMAGYLVMATGMAIGAIAGHGVALLGFSLAAFMFFAMQSIIFNWLPSIMSGHMLAGSFGLLNCLGLCGGFLGPFILGAFEDRTGAATSGLWFAVALLIVGALVSVFIKSSSSPAVHRQNRPTAKKRNQGGSYAHRSLTGFKNSTRRKPGLGCRTAASLVGWTASTGACSPVTRRAARLRAGTCGRKLALSPCARTAKARWWRYRMACICSTSPAAS
ncbi:nitrate/nitrite transporter [Klebsiella michiganensis]|uniref:Nitrate/nitrite transporter n=1 Tax=Klebsiella michiganensis TaxID=1134687 RepID=A0A7H4PI91_9ENTR|nr:nitrate/nitrite transporter [Klebsiella michiganensis]